MRWSAVLVLSFAGLACASASEEGADQVWAPMAATMEVQVTPSTVHMLYHVTNAGDEPIRFEFPTTQRYDIVVTTREGDELWRWSDRQAFGQAITRATLAPGETWEMTGTWDHGSRAGSYIATGILAARDRTLRKAASFEIR